MQEHKKIISIDECGKDASDRKIISATKDLKDPMFKSFFFKNAIFRTAQSIIENHEKKHAKNKDQSNISSVTPSCITNELQKKMDFKVKLNFKSNQKPIKSSTSSTDISSFKSSNKKEMKKSSSTNSMKIPGAACMIKELSMQLPQIKTERGQTGLLRFLESPVFNIHFAIHYLFYSKEPGVLSFIGNKIFR